MQQQSQRRAPVVRQKTSPTNDCHTLHNYLGKSYLSYARGVSWFRTHPPFYERMVSGEREIMFLPNKDNYVMQSSEFEQMKKALAPATTQSEKEQKDKPSLLMPEKGCAQPQKADYKPGEPIDKICARKAW